MMEKTTNRLGGVIVVNYEGSVAGWFPTQSAESILAFKHLVVVFEGHAVPAVHVAGPFLFGVLGVPSPNRCGDLASILLLPFSLGQSALLGHGTSISHAGDRVK